MTVLGGFLEKVPNTKLSLPGATQGITPVGPPNEMAPPVQSANAVATEPATNGAPGGGASGARLILNEVIPATEAKVGSVLKSNDSPPTSISDEVAKCTI
jgi:hypothetical protein